MKKVTDLGPNEAIHCPTLEQAEAICKLMHEAGLKWADGESCLKYMFWDYHGDKTCYFPKKGSFINIDHITEIHTIHPATDFLPTESVSEKTSIPLGDVFKVLDTVQMLPWALTGDEAIEWARRLLNEYKQKAL